MTEPLEDLCPNCPTFVAITGNSYCGACKKIEPMLREFESESKVDKTYHFMWFDDNNPTGRMMKRKFKVTAVPTLLLYNPATKRYVNYTGKRDKEHIKNALRDMHKMIKYHGTERALDYHLPYDIYQF